MQQVRPKVQFVILPGEHEHSEEDARSSTHGATPSLRTVAPPPPVPPKFPSPTSPPGPSHDHSQAQTPSSAIFSSGQPRIRHRYSSSDPGHSFIPAPSPSTTSSTSPTKARTMPGYRTAHMPLPARTHRDTRPNNLDSIIESIPPSSTNPYGRVYTGVASPHDNGTSELGETPQAFVFPRMGSKSTVTIGRASASTVALGHARDRKMSNKLKKAPPTRSRAESEYRGAYPPIC